MANTLYHYAEFSCAELVLTSNTAKVYPLHTHTNHWVIGMVYSGTASLNTGNKSLKLMQGGSFIVPPGVAHALAITPQTVLAVLCLNTGKDIQENINDLITSLCSAKTGPYLPQGLTLAELNKLRELSTTLTKNEYEIPAVSAQIKPVLTLLQEHPEESFSITKLAELAGYSRWHFIRIFQAQTGMTPHAYQLICRLRLLRVLLRADTAQAEAAVSAGFTDQSHMSKIFKLHHGLTPKQFKQASVKAK